MSGVSTNTILRNLKPDTEHTITVVPVYSDMEGMKQSEKGKTSVFQSNLFSYYMCIYIKAYHSKAFTLKQICNF